MIKEFGRVHKMLLNERGMALVTSLLILTALTAIAVTAMNNTITETMISGNDFQSQKRIYAAEGAANLVFASLPDMLSTSTINNLLSRSYDNDPANRGDLTSSSNSPLGMGDMSSFYDPEPGVATYSVRIEDNESDLGNTEDNDLYNDVDGTVFLKVFRTTTSGNSNAELTMQIAPLGFLSHDAAVNLIDPITGINLNGNYEIDATTEPGKNGIATTATWANIGNQGKVKPGIKYESSLSSEEIREFKEALIRYATPITPPDADDGLGNYTVTVENTTEDTTPLTQVSYVRGNLEMRNATGSGILIIEEYNDANNVDHMGLILEASNFDGLIIMFPKNRDPNFEDSVKIELKHRLGEDSSVDGIIVAGSSSDQGIEFYIYKSRVTYEKTIAEGLLANRYVVTNWSRRGN